jgi:hypothetical protein
MKLWFLMSKDILNICYGIVRWDDEDGRMNLFIGKYSEVIAVVSMVKKINYRCKN